MRKDTVTITCPKCGHSQKAAENIYSTFCKRCNSRIENKEAVGAKRKKGLGFLSRHGKSKQPHKKNVTCPHCQAENSVYQDAVSAFCTGCKKIISLRKGKGSSDKLPPGTKIEGKLIKVKCFHCENLQEVSVNAYSATCSRCGSRIQVKDMEIKGKHSGDINTGGRLFIRPGSFVQANIKATDIEIEGEVRGTIHAENYIILKAGSRVFGELDAKNFVVSEGAIIKGSVKVNAVLEQDHTQQPELAEVK